MFLGNVACVAMFSFFIAIIAGFVTTDHGSAARGFLLSIRVGDTKPIAINRDGNVSVARSAPEPSVGCGP